MRPYIIPDLLQSVADKYPEKTAVRQKARTITFLELYIESLKMKTLILEWGIKKGDRVGILLDKSIEQIVSMFGVSMAGAVFVFINPVLKKRQIEHIVQDCQIRLLITTRLLHERNHLTATNQVLYMDEDAQDETPLYWHQLSRNLQPKQDSIEQVADDIACLIYTSGSTGLPKGVVVPHRTVVEGAEIVSGYLRINQNDKLISVLPFNFDYGLNQLTTSILHGATLVLHHFFLPKDLLKVLQDEEITGFAGMTPIWLKLFDEKYSAPSDYYFPHLRYITNTGGKVPEATLSKMRHFFPNTKIFLMYGLTEAFRSTYLAPDELEKRPNSIGKAIPNVEILVVDQQGQECAPGEPGELVHRGALITRGYWNDPEKTHMVFRKNPRFGGQDHLNEIVVYSGDLVRKDEEGFLYFISRRDEMIKTSGYRVSPTEIEEVLIEIPGVKNSVVFGRELETTEQLIVAVIEADGHAIDERSVVLECMKRLPRHMVPGKVHFETQFKTTANGKIDRSYLKQKWLAKVG